MSILLSLSLAVYGTVIVSFVVLTVPNVNVGTVLSNLNVPVDFTVVVLLFPALSLYVTGTTHK